MSDDKEQKQKGGAGREIMSWIKTIVLAVLIAIGINSFMCQS